MTHFIIDTDPGHDDAVAILVAAKYLNLAGITTVFGNTGVEHTTHNALAIIEAAHLDIPVARGAAGPLTGNTASAETIHGKSGLDGANFPPPRGKPHALDGPRFIIDAANRYDDLVIIAIAPLTNLAMALDAEPGIANRIREISIMGGSTGHGNATPAAEFNIFADPEAAARVFGAGIPLTMAGLNVTMTFGVGQAHIERLRQSGKRVAGELAGALNFYLGRQATLYNRNYAPLHDVCAVLPFTHPNLIGHTPMHVDVELKGELTRGMTVCDQRGIAAGNSLVAAKPANARVATQARGDEIIELVLDTLTEFP